MAETHPNQGQVKVASGIDIPVAVWLFISPWVVAMTMGLAWSNWIVGVIVVVLACIRAFGAYGAEGISWINFVLGIWVIISPWFITRAATDADWWNNVLTGAAIVILAFWSAMATHSEPHTPPHTMQPA